MRFLSIALSAMTSTEPARTTAYSPNIGWRVVWQKIGIGLAFKEIATHLQIGVGTAHRLYARYVDTGDVALRTQPECPDKRKLELYMIGLIHENSAFYLLKSVLNSLGNGCICFWIYRM